MHRLTLVAVLVVGAKAWACSGLTCGAVAIPVPAAGATIPVNATAVGVQRTIFSDALIDGGIEYQSPTAETLQLRAPDGGLVTGPAVDSQIGVFIDTTLSPGSWSMALGQPVCPTNSQFTVGAAAALPTLSATVTLSETFFTREVVGFNSCYGPRPAQQVARLRIEPSVEMQPWLALARWELQVDGANVNTSMFGAITAQAFDPAPSLPSHSLNVFTVQCGETPDGGGPDARYLQPGLHEVKVQARILGVSTPIPTNVLQVNLVCTAPPKADAGTMVPADAGTNIGPPASGCSSVAGLEFFAFLLVWLRRRAS